MMINSHVGCFGPTKLISWITTKLFRYKVELLKILFTFLLWSTFQSLYFFTFTWVDIWMSTFYFYLSSFLHRYSYFYLTLVPY